MILCTVDGEIFKIFPTLHWGTLLSKFSTIFRCSFCFSQIGELLPIFTSQILSLFKMLFLCLFMLLTCFQFRMFVQLLLFNTTDLFSLFFSLLPTFFRHVVAINCKMSYKIFINQSNVSVYGVNKIWIYKMCKSDVWFIHILHSITTFGNWDCTKVYLKHV